MANEKITALIEAVKTLTVVELSELVHALEDEFGVSAQAVAAPAAASAAPAEEAVAVEAEQTEFDVVLTDSGPSKINTIKTVREVTGLGLKEAKELVDSIPKSIKEKVSKDEADAISEKLAEVGAKVEIK